ncbi:putative cellulase [Helianthus annuus]|uniref:Cellulase n=1 Tax=Helianthus annuus TaxID=4232 RepID=A0A251RLV1_HELAN|nr:glycosyl hydrolase 5 family protein [Helianthus annuus]KAF5754115.1 putative cellulase [Helianthus annuus]KAJ0432054.1 putative cellulase [Helianthus annuus]
MGWNLSSLLPLLLLATVFHHHSTVALPLSTNSRWIVSDGEGGERVKLSCVNWVSHLDAVVAEGLSKQPVDVISKKILDMGFNCVRLTYPLFLFTNDSLASVSVRQSLKKLGLIESIAGFQANNPSFIDLPLIKAFQEVVASLDRNNVMMVLDNQISKPGWCCSDFDGNGFFGDRYFDPDVWLKGLAKVATMFNSTKNVVGMSLRNELRGPKQNVSIWYRYMQKGAEVVHAANPNVLVILSGLSYDKDLSFIQTQDVSLTFSNKLVFEAHWYGFSNSEEWETGNPNQVCGRIVDNIMQKSGFLLEKGYPLFISEWGVDQRGTNENDNRYLNCFMAWAADTDLDWAIWTLAGSYYFREGVVGMEEFYGVLNWDWCEARNSSFLKKISPIQSPFQGPGLSNTRPHKVIFHPATGLCVQRQSLFKPLTLGACAEAEHWDYTQKQTLTIKGTYYCLQTDGVGKKAKLGLICTDSSSKWEAISASKLHLSSKTNNGTVVCLDVDSENNIVTNNCRCLTNDNGCDPASQWFKIINSTMSAASEPYSRVDAILQSLGANLFG